MLARRTAYDGMASKVGRQADKAGRSQKFPQFLKLWELRMSAALDDFEPLLTKADVARLLKVSSRTINNAMIHGLAGRPPLKPVLTGQILRFDPAHVRAWLAGPPEATEPVEPVNRGRGRPKKYRPSGK